MTPRAGRSEPGSSGRGVALVGVAALLVALAYCLVYAWRGYAVPIGLDTPVYLWSGRYAAEFGLGADGLLGRPGAFGAVATLFGLLPADDLTVTAATPIAVIVVSALAAAAFLGTLRGPQAWIVAGATLLVGLFLTPLADGFLASSMFLACFVAGLAVLTDAGDPTWRSTVLAATLFAAGGLSHPVFAAIGLPIVGTMAAVLLLRRRSLPTWRSPLRRISWAAAIAAGLTVVRVLVLAPGAVPLDTSYDGALKRLGAVARTVIFRRHALEAELPAFLFLLLAGLIALDRFTFRPTADRVSRTLFWSACAGWIAVTVAAVAALAIGQPVPAHRLVWVCLPPVLAAAAATSWPSSDRPRPRAPWGRIVQLAVPVAVVAVFASAHALRIRGIRPTVTTPEAAFLASFGNGLERSPADTDAILFAGDLVLIPDMIDELNWLRAWTGPDRLHDVAVFPGDPATFYGGGPEPFGDRAYDLVVADYVARVRSTVEAGTVLVAATPIDAEAAAEAREVDGSRPFGADAVLLPASPGRSAVEVASSASAGRLMAPWSVTVWTPPLIAVLGLIGIGWVRWSAPGRPALVSVALAPAVGLAMLTVASVVVDVVGIRLGAGGWIVATAIALVPGAVLGGAVRRVGRRSGEERMTR